jgi:hypothetical protein
MTARDIAARVNARSSDNRRWVARCPAHDDRRPSLSIADGRDGRVLLRCFAGCEIERIVHALGLALADLFERATTTERRAPHPPSVTELCRALTIEECNVRDRYGIVGLLRASELNSIRATVAKRYGVELAAIARPLCEGGFGGRDRDAAWPAIFERAIFVAGVRLFGAPVAFDETLLPPKAILIEAEQIAALAMCDLERKARQRPSIAT